MFSLLTRTSKRATKASRLSDLNADHSETAQAIGSNLGMFAVGKRLVFVEGDDSSVDRMTYHRIAETILTECSIVPDWNS